ncbi:MAG: hypothetical protein IJP96_10060 [Synergistaceae bacterium]|nr:hypothetical protein [Synergistaceae bacterium]MBR0233088.1 hypothetical protein [Synergistaceae bacterium]MBR0253600.1 hypothetical protein [Synergistaceae bacterium]MBR0315358.1 hypothetical protein [Synergistaceae bacterium]
MDQTKAWNTQQKGLKPIHFAKSNIEKIKFAISYDWKKMKEAEINMTGNEFTLCLRANGEIGLNGAIKFTGRETIDKFLAKVKEQVEIAFETQE